MALLYSCANSIKYKISIVFLLNFTLIFRFLMGYEFYTTLIITCLYFCFLPEIIRGGFKIKERIKEIFAILTSMFLSLFIAIFMHGYLSPDGIVSNFARMLNRSNARSATGSTPISTMVSTIESYFLNWPKMFGWPIWYSENNVLVIPLPIVSNIKVTGQDFIILSLIIVLMFFISLIQKNKSISNFLPIISILGPLSWLILYPIHEDEHGIDFFLMYFGSIQAILYILLQGLNNLVIKNLNLGGALFKRKIS